MSLTTNASRQLIIIDSQIPNWQSLAAGIDSDSLLLILDPSVDGLTQISDYLERLSLSGAAGLEPLDGIQIISHGSSGSLLLGSSRLNSSNLELYANQLATLGGTLSDSGDLVLYGCNVAQGQTGQDFIKSLAEYTGADVAASDDLTGNAALGGNWLLEAETGSIETKPVLTTAVQQSYASLLLADDYADNIGTTGRVNIGGSVTGNIDLANDSDWFKVDLVAGTRYVFDLSGLDSGGGTLGVNGGTPYLSLHNKQGTFFDATAGGGPGDDPRASYTPTASGTYYLEVSELGDNRTGTYTLKAFEAGTADDYVDNTGTSGRVSVGGSVAGDIDLANDSDWFKVDLVAGTRYVFDLSGLASGGGTLGANGGTPYLSLHNKQGTFFDATAGGGPGDDPRASYTPTASGTYYLEVSELGDNRTGTYTLKASVAGTADDYADNTRTTGRVSVGGSVAGDIDLANDSDWFKVDLVAGTRYVFDLSGLDSGGGTLGVNGGTPYLSLHNKQGTFFDATASGGPGGDPRASYMPTASGTYYLEVSELGDNRTGTYTLKASVAGTADDYAENTGTTGRVSVGGSVSGNIELVNDADWFKVDLVAGTRYVFGLSGKDSGGGTLGVNGGTPYLSLHNTQGTFFDATAGGGPGGDPSASYTPTVSGTYYLEVSELGDSTTGTYTLKASVATTADDYADNTATIGRVNIGGSVSGNIDLANDSDWFKVDLVAGTRYVFDLSGLDSGGGTLGVNGGTPYLSLHNSQGTFFDATASGGPGDDPRTSYIPTVSGTYYLEVSELGDNWTGTYTLTTLVANTINGDASNNIIDGTYADDLIQGLAGDDTLNGGLANDILEAGAGNDTLNGEDGDDRLLGDAGNDVLNGGNGIDWANYNTATAAVKVNLSLSTAQITGGAGLDKLNSIENLQGSRFNDTLTGDAGDNVIDGGLGADTLTGGLGDDSYVVDDALDKVMENLNQGNDSVNSSVSYTLKANLENLTLTGSASIDATGNELNNIVTGNDAGNTLTGGAGNDTLVGGRGDDSFVFERGFGQDVIRENDATLGNIDRIVFGKNIAPAQVSIFRDGMDLLLSLSTSDQIRVEGWFSDDAHKVERVEFNDATVWDVAKLSTASPATTVINYIDTAFDDTFASATGSLVPSYVNAGAFSYGILDGIDNGDGTVRKSSAYGILTVTKSTGAYRFEPTDAAIEPLKTTTSISFTITASDGVNTNTQALTVNIAQDGATESIGKDKLTGTAGNDRFDGMAGADTLSGGLGNDYYIVDVIKSGILEVLKTGNFAKLEDSVIEKANAGVDTVVLRAVNLQLAQASTIKLAANVENLDASSTATTKLNLTGNSGDNQILGNATGNIIDGGAGKDQLQGGLGDDIYLIDNALDTVTESNNAGKDTVIVNIATAGGVYSLGSHVEDARLASKVAYDLIGNELANSLAGNAAQNTLQGGGGDDFLYGGGGADLMQGGAGNDTYSVDHKNDVVTENAGEGNDLVYSSVNLILPEFVENLILTGKAAISGTGNGSANGIAGNGAANALTGNDGNDRLFGLAGNDVLDGGNGDDLLVGGAGKDTLTGGAGADSFWFDTVANAASNKDTLTDFLTGTDKLQFSASMFTALGANGHFGVDDTRFYASADGIAHDANDRLIYNTTTGVLSYDSNGNASGGAIAVAILGTNNHPSLTSADIWVI